MPVSLPDALEGDMRFRTIHELPVLPVDEPGNKKCMGEPAEINTTIIIL